MPYTAPVIMDTYSRAMAPLFNEQDIIGTPFGGQMFFGGGNGFMGSTYWEPDAEVFEYDISRGRTDLAPMILRGTDAEDMDDNKGIQIENWTNVARVYPLIEDFGTISSAQIAKRIKGEGAYQKLNKALRARRLMRELHKIAMQKSYYTMEYLAWYVLRFAKMPILLGATATDQLYNFYRNANHAITPAAAWSNPSTDIMGDLDTGWELVNQNAHMDAKILLCGDTVLDSIIRNTDIQTISDNRRYYHNALQAPLPAESGLQNFRKNGFGYHGTLTTTTGNEFYLFSYKKFYTSTAGSNTRYLPINECIMISESHIGDRHYGPDDLMPLTVQEQADYANVVGVDMEQPRGQLDGLPTVTPRFDPRWFAYKLSRTEKTWKVKTQVAPVYVPVTVDGVVRYITS